MSLFDDVRQFHTTFFPEFVPSTPSFANKDAVEASLNHLEEEFIELYESFSTGDLVDILDAIVDMVYVLLGLAVRLGLPFDQAWKIVHASNMQKVRGEGRRGKIDVIKPDGWSPPNLRVLFDDHKA